MHALLIAYILVDAIIADAKTQPVRMELAGNRISGGSNAPQGFAPHQVSLRRGKNTTRHFCGGSLVSECHVVTAAHCAPACPNATCKVGYGSTALSKQILLDVESITAHEDYFVESADGGGIKTIRNDVAIIKLKKSGYPQFDSNTNSIKLNKDYVRPARMLTTTGWGLTDSGQTSPPEDLQMTKIASSICGLEMRDWYYFICTNALTTGVCPGDSGGPLVYNGKLVGITSFGNRCGSTISQNGFTEVRNYADWIEDKIEETPC